MPALPLPLEQAPTDGTPFDCLLGRGHPDGPHVLGRREVFRGKDGVLKVAVPLDEVYDPAVVALAYLPPPSKEAD